MNKRDRTLIHTASHPSRQNTDEEKNSGWINLKCSLIEKEHNKHPNFHIVMQEKSHNECIMKCE